ncbi:hypothetical protein M885DRAFT_499589 [Pelagophyceae sp. CCMP2097]|nr:hypothetical protein M885DRAFT_499589 [Pelagophyceae sp. CCMP2097]
MDLAAGDATRARLRFPRPFPALRPPAALEYFWLEGTTEDSPLAALLAAACNAPLAAQQAASLLALLRRGGAVAQALPPRDLPKLVENNPLVAIECLCLLMPTPTSTDYLSALVSMDMSLHSMEVVHRLSATEVPPEFIHLYISNCIAACESHRDKYTQNRLVRLVCVSLCSCLRGRFGIRHGF